jgi:hypothetical protein
MSGELTAQQRMLTTMVNDALETIATVVPSHVAHWAIEDAKHALIMLRRSANTVSTHDVPAARGVAPVSSIERATKESAQRAHRFCAACNNLTAKAYALMQSTGAREITEHDGDHSATVVRRQA